MPRPSLDLPRDRKSVKKCCGGKAEPPAVTQSRSPRADDASAPPGLARRRRELQNQRAPATTVRAACATGHDTAPCRATSRYDTTRKPTTQRAVVAPMPIDARPPMRAHSIPFLLAFASALAAQGGDAKAPRTDALAAAWQQALTQAKSHKAPMLAFVLPPAAAPAPNDRSKATWDREREVGICRAFREQAPPELTARELMLHQLQLLRVPKFAGGRGIGRVDATPRTAIFALTIPVVATAETCGAKPGETVVLLGADGKRVAGFTLDLLDAAKFEQEVGAIVLAPKTLAARTATVPPAVARDVEALPKPRQDDLGYIEDQALRARLAASFVAAAPALITWREGELAIHPSLWTLEDERSPLGTERPIAMADECLGCGMGFTPPALKGVLKLLGP